MRVARAPLILTALVTLAALALVLPCAARAEDQRQLAVILLPDTRASNYTELRILTPSGGLVRTIVGRPSNNLASPSWSPDEKTLAYSENGNVLLQPVAGGAEKTFVPGIKPAWSPTADQLAYWSFTSPNTSLHLIDADGSHDHVIAGPFPSNSVDVVSPSWSPDGKTLAFSVSGAIETVPAAGGASPTAIVSPGPGELLQRPAFAPDGTHLAFVRYPNLPLSPDGRRRDLLVVRDLTTGTEQTVVDHTSGRVYMGNVASPSWSADSQRIAYIEDDFGFSPTRYRAVTVSRDGSARQVLLENDKFINFVSWDNVPTRPNYYVRDVEVAQAISPDLEPPLPFDSQPQLSDPYTREWQQSKAFGTPIPLIADKSTLLRIYVGDAKLPSGSTARRSIHFRVVDEATSIPYDGTQDADVTAPGVAPVQTQAVSAINVWLPAEAATPGVPHNFAVEINADETAPECAGCYPNGNRATVTGVAFEEGGNVVLAPVPIIEYNPDRTLVRPDAHELQKAVDDAVRMLPVADDGVKIDSSSPGALLVPRQEITADDGCHRLLTELLTLRASADITGPVAGFGATRWVGYAPPILQPPNASPCEGKAEQPGRNLVLLGPNADTFAHELGHTLGLTHIRGRSGGGLRFRLFASSYPYSPGIGGVGYKLEPLAGASFTGILPSSTTADIMSYDDQTWTSPRTWLMMYERILAESGSSRPRADSARAAATARAPAIRRLVSGVVNGNKSVIYGSVVTVASNVAQAGPQAARVLAIDRRGKTVAQATIRGTAYLDKGQSQPTLPFVVALPNKTSIASIELLPARGHRPLARLKRTRHAPTGRLLQLPKRVRGTRVLTVRWRSADRDRGDKLTVMLLARRGRGAFRAIVLGPATGSFGLVPRKIGRRGKLSLRLQVSDGFTTTVLGARPITVR